MLAILRAMANKPPATAPCAHGRKAFGDFAPGRAYGEHGLGFGCRPTGVAQVRIDAFVNELDALHLVEPERITYFFILGVYPGTKCASGVLDKCIKA